MKSDSEIRHEGFQLLFTHMDIVEAEKFIALINRERFDYTQWRQHLFEDLSVDKIIEHGKKFAIDFRKIEGTL